LIAWRICKEKYANRDAVLEGDGAKRYGGRWNRPGLPIVYTSDSSSLAMLETLVQADIRTLPRSLGVVPITIPDDVLVRTIGVADLNAKWRDVGDAQCVALGSDWLRAAETVALIVPSAVNPFESNVLLNPLHSDIARCMVGDFSPVLFDSRLIRLFGHR
jgi:RES domain-containing protein